MDLIIFKFNAASKTNSNLLSDVMRTDTNYLMNAIKKHVKNWTPPLTPFWLFGLIKMFSAISSYILLRNQIIFLFLVLRPFVLYNQVVRLFGLLTGLEVLAGQNDFIKTYICVKYLYYTLSTVLISTVNKKNKNILTRRLFIFAWFRSLKRFASL